VPTKHTLPNRRVSDPTNSLAQEVPEDVNTRLDLILERVEELALRQANMAEIVLAWNNTKGFVNTVKTISRVVRWVTLTSIACAGLWYFITHGTWPKG
jgi:hypothetical protein